MMAVEVIRAMAHYWCMGLAHGDARARRVAAFWADAFERNELAASVAWLMAVGRRR